MILASDLLCMQRAQALIIGDVMLDIYVQGVVSRISPEAPVPVLLEKSRKWVLGGAANVAANVAAFGAQATLVGRIGQDAEASKLLELCSTFGIDVGGMITEPSLRTTRKTRMMASYQQLVRVDAEDVAPAIHTYNAQVWQEVERFLGPSHPMSPPFRAVILSDYGKGFLTPELVQGVIGRCREKGVPVIVDPKSIDSKRYTGCTVLKPNLGEAREMGKSYGVVPGMKNWREEVLELGPLILKEVGAQSVAMSLSENGVMGFTRDPASGAVVAKHYGSQVREVADVSGAGDTMVAFLGLGAAVGLPFSKQLIVANAASGLSCSKLGTATVTLTELISSLKDEGDTSENGLSKILGFGDVAGVVSELRQKKATLVFTNGCFDILHAGHVRYLQAAKRMGHTLIVGVNADASIQRLKGEKRPIQSLPDRLEVLAGLGCVDFVVGFEEDTPLSLIHLIKPDVLVKGADYSKESIVGYEDVVGWGGRVEVVPLYPGRSTSAIVEQLSHGQR